MELPPTKIIGMLVLFVVLILFGALYLSSSGTSAQQSTSSTTAVFKTTSTTTINLTGGTTTIPLTYTENITVSGVVNINATGMNATSISFYEANSNKTYSTKVNGGSYNVQLPNLQTYDVVVFWAGQYPWQTGFNPVKPTVWKFDLGLVNQTNATYDVNFSLPNGIVNVNGSVRMTSPNVTPSGQVLRDPVQIIFKAPNGMKFTGNITEYNLTNQFTNQTYYFYNYTMEVPNLQTYNVTIKWNGQYSTIGYCNENSTVIYVGAGLENMTENYVC